MAEEYKLSTRKVEKSYVQSLTYAGAPVNLSDLEESNDRVRKYMSYSKDLASVLDLNQFWVFFQ